MRDRGMVLRLARHALVRPRLLIRLVAAGWRFRARDWYRRPPFLPLPPREYLEWRLHTAFGDGGEPTPAQLDRYLQWVSRMRRGARSG